MESDGVSRSEIDANVWVGIRRGRRRVRHAPTMTLALAFPLNIPFYNRHSGFALLQRPDLSNKTFSGFILKPKYPIDDRVSKPFSALPVTKCYVAYIQSFRYYVFETLVT